MTIGEQAARDHDKAELRKIVDLLNAAARKLPQCSDGAKIRAIASHLTVAAAYGSEPVPQLVRRLAAATRDALETDPWLIVDRLARRLLGICEPASVDHVPATSERRRNACPISA